MITDTFVQQLRERAQQADVERRLSTETMDDYAASGLADLLVPSCFGGDEAPWPAILDPIRRLAHGCSSTAWTLGFYTLHNWMLALFPEQAQKEVFAGDRPVLAPAPLAPNGRGEPVDGGVRLSGRWSWATGVLHGNWLMVGALCGPEDARLPMLCLLPLDEAEVIDTWQTDGMRATGSNDVVVSDAFIPEHRVLSVIDIYAGTTPGASLHAAAAYRWPMVPALALAASMVALGSAERVTELFAERLAERVMGFEGTKQMDKPVAQVRLADAQVRLRALDGLVAGTVARIEALVAAGDAVPKPLRAEARLAAAHVVQESRAVIGGLIGASGASAHFLDHPLQRYRRDVEVLAGHVVFDHDVTAELAGALALGMKVSPFAMV
ncbi:hypothetical protein ACFQ0K_04075 [Nocardioides caeni]|uniref:Acyl-CoA dehydrogenase n=1 Tax=Nocardioides caeni TaxID=574700 RepID=A0A4S8MZV3_9ACTN|nr:acyl-CoA dehydrogenase [Nocardioides caeni]THV09018.1 acyl-CoA dehydrogenase [Nocardioides caeni]